MTEKKTMILLIDIGNTCLKWGWPDAGWDNHSSDSLPQIVCTGAINHSESQFESLLDEHWNDLDRPEQVWLVSVAKESVSQAVASWVHKHWGREVFVASSESSSDELINAYTEPQRLGVDRWLGLLAAHRFTTKSCVIVDCGSAITLDVLSEGGEHRGGHILPGLQMMRNAVYGGAAGVKQTKDSGNRLNIFANNTEDAVAAGSLYAVVAYIDRVLSDLEQALSKQTVCLVTGGDAEILVPLLAGRVERCPDLVLQGLAVYGQQAGWK